MQQSEGPPDAVDDWQLLIANDDELVWRLAFEANWASGGTERRYDQIEAERNLSTNNWKITKTQYRPNDANTRFVAAVSETVDKTPTRQGAIKIAVETMVTGRGRANAVDDEQWVTQLDPSPQFSGNQLTDFDASDTPDTPDESLRERLIEQEGGRVPGGEKSEWPTMPKQVGEWTLGTVTDDPDLESPTTFEFVYGTSATARDEPPRIVSVSRTRFKDHEYAAFVSQPEISGSMGTTDPITTANSRTEMADRIIRRLDRNPPSETDHPRWDDAVLDVATADPKWSLNYMDLTANKTKIQWKYEPDAGDPDDCGPWRIGYGGQLNTNDYQFRYDTGPNVSDRINERSTKFQPESLDVIVPPRPSIGAIADRARQIAERITADPCDPWGHSEIEHPDPTVETLSPREVEVFLDQADSELTSESIEMESDKEFMLSKMIEMIDRVGRLDKTQSDRFKIAKIERIITDVRRTLDRSFEGTMRFGSDEVDRVAEAVVDEDDHPAEFTDDAIDAIKRVAELNGFENIATDNVRDFE